MSKPHLMPETQHQPATAIRWADLGMAPLLRLALVQGVVGLGLLAAPTPARAMPGTDAAAGSADNIIYLPILSPQPLPVAPVGFSHPHGFHGEPFALELRSDTSDAVLRYTLDGSVPTASHGEVYGAPLVIAETTILRVAAFRLGMAPSPVATRSYIFVADVLAQPEQPDLRRFPPFWGYYTEEFETGQPVPPDYAMDRAVIDGPSSTGRIAGDLRALPSISVVMDPIDLFGSPPDFGASSGIYSHPLGEGAEWERQASVELLATGGDPGFQIDSGIRIAGNWSRKPDVTPKHSFSLRFRSRYGAARLEYPLFRDSPVTRFDTLRLRAGQADSFPYLPRSLYVHDQWGRDTQLAMGGPAARGSFAHLYLNGLYWGLYNLAEEPTAAFAEDHLGGDEAEWDVIKGHEIVGIVHGKPVSTPSFVVEDGEAAAFEAMLAIPRGGPPEPARYQQLTEQLNIDQHIDYTLLEIYSGNDDWLAKNWRALRRRLPGERWRFLIWDIERSVFLRALDPRCGDASGQHCDQWQRGEASISVVGDVSNTPGVLGLHGWMRGLPDYRLRFADRARRHLFEDGLLTPAAVRRRYSALLDRVEPGIEGESARWGDAGPRPRTRNENFTPWSLFWAQTPDRRIRRAPQWVVERTRLLDQAIPQRTDIVIGQLCQAGLFPPVAPLRFEIDADGGTARGPTRVAIEGLRTGCPNALTEGTIFYTLDGSDPRRPGSGTPGIWWDGSVDRSARAYVRPIDVEGYAHLRARLAVQVEGRLWWGALIEIAIGTPRLAVSELMYHPAPGAPEFLELHNLEPAPIDLGGASFDGISLSMPAGTLLAPDGYLVIARDAARFQAVHPQLPLAAEYSGSLSNGGERIRLRDRAGRLLVDLRYDDEGFWPLGADRLGHSLVPAGFQDAADDPEAWRESADPGGSPGREDPPAPWPRVLLSELLANSDPPYEDAIELFNPGLAPADIGGWWLSDDPSALQGYRIPLGTVLPPGGYAVFYETALRIGNGGEGFALSSAGESAVLASAGPDGSPNGYLRGHAFGPTAPNVSLGRHRNSQGLLEWVPQTRPSFGIDAPTDPVDFRRGQGQANSGPRAGPLLISEIMYAPESGKPEWIELRNASDGTVHLFDPADRSRTWGFGAGVDYRFPAGAWVPAGGRALVIGGDPVAFRAAHDLPRDVPVFGPFAGRLDNAGERLSLVQPFERDADDASTLWIEIEHIDFEATAPWPRLAAPGASLERIEPSAYANDPKSWQSLRQGGTPGRAPSQLTLLYLPRLELDDG